MMATVAVDNQPLRQKFLKPKWKMREMMVNIILKKFYELQFSVFPPEVDPPRADKTFMNKENLDIHIFLSLKIVNCYLKIIPVYISLSFRPVSFYPCRA